MGGYSKKIEGILTDIKHKIGLVYTIEDSKEKVIEQMTDISIRMDKTDLLERKINRLEEEENHFKSINVELKDSHRRGESRTRNKETKL